MLGWRFFGGHSFESLMVAPGSAWLSGSVGQVDKLVFHGVGPHAFGHDFRLVQVMQWAHPAPRHPIVSGNRSPLCGSPPAKCLSVLTMHGADAMYVIQAPVRWRCGLTGVVEVSPELQQKRVVLSVPRSAS